MPPSFTAAEWNKLSKDERIAMCKAHAAEAQTLAELAPSELTKTYLHIAEQWLKLVAELETMLPPAAR